MKPELIYPSGCDYEWLALDSEGYVAIFTSAGCAPIPTSILRQASDADLLSAAVRDLPIKGKAHMLAPLPRPDDYIYFSSRGLFAYDWRDLHRSSHNCSNAYEMLSKPEHPIRIDEFPEQFRHALARIRFDTLSFRSEEKIAPQSLVSCEIEK